MLNARCLPRTIPRIQKTPQAWRNFGNRAHNNNNNNTRVAVSPYAYRRQQHFIRSIATVATLGAIASAWQWCFGNRIFREAHAEGPPPEPELEFEKPRRRAVSKEDNRDLISSQHLQVKKSWENPGVYAWGSNSGRVAAPDSDEEFIKTPRRIPLFDGVLLRDLKLDRNFAAAIDDKGDLLQWGTGYSKENRSPTHTLRGKNFTSLTISRDRIIALSATGIVYSIPVSRVEQKMGPKTPSNTWLPFWDNSNSISYRTLTPHNLAWNERITTIAGGLEHVLLLTSKGRVFSAAAGSQDFPSKGQMGIPGLTWQTRPPGSYDQCHEITTLRGFEITSIAAGDYHSLVADRSGRAFAFGDNSLCQLGFDCTPDSTFVDVPALPIQKPYAGTSQVPRVTSVAAGGSTSFFTVDATEPASAASPGNAPRVSADTLSCGQGIWGQLGTGRWTHAQATPTRIPALSGLSEYDEARKRAVPIRLARLSVGSSHAAAVLDNVTHVAASARSSENDTNWGADVVFFGSNEFYQLGTGKRNNAAAPVYIRPLDAGAEREQGREGNRFQITSQKKVKVAGRSVEMEQRVECGRGVTAVYSGV